MWLVPATFPHQVLDQKKKKVMVLTFGEGSRLTAARDTGKDAGDVSVEVTEDVELVVRLLLVSLLIVVVLVLFIVVVTAAGEVIVMECGSSVVGLS